MTGIFYKSASFEVFQIGHRFDGEVGETEIDEVDFLIVE